MGAGCDRIDLDAVSGAFGGEVPGEREHGSLGGGVAGQLGDPPEHRLRGGVDDASVASSHEMGPGGSGDEDRSEEVDVEHGSELLGSKPLERPGVVDAGVVDDDVESSERLDSRMDDRRRARLFGDRGA